MAQSTVIWSGPSTARPDLNRARAGPKHVAGRAWADLSARRAARCRPDIRELVKLEVSSSMTCETCDFWQVKYDLWYIVLCEL